MPGPAAPGITMRDWAQGFPPGRGVLRPHAFRWTGATGTGFRRAPSATAPTHTTRFAECRSLLRHPESM